MATKQPKFSRKAPVRRKEPGISHVIPFFVVLAVLTAVSFIIPLRPTVSHIEKRNLAEFPEFSMKDLVSGDYFDDITTWFAGLSRALTSPGMRTITSAARARMTGRMTSSTSALRRTSFCAWLRG